MKRRRKRMDLGDLIIIFGFGLLVVMFGKWFPLAIIVLAVMWCIYITRS